ncbi:MerR family transcriptional regulator [Streptomyces ipomoeae]|uniref:helix-turn-helix domain-containing protein n=1 Tax=Streptomyces ipomoeae TaxID=103232 RepID=UPI0011468867|nr:MerR family transcriptional regulator [Streptomyces ipomoeae]MDX2934334.1 MerR family transcriptional regulator [Streptomyces ipomoeae]TQE17739.1 MerR family transcriptional regulator [Streptomyces ipomoeae]
MSADELWSIGELAEHAGVTVKTVRFYSDRGLLPEAARSAGGHRRYGREAVDRLRLIRSLRTLDLPVGAIDRVLGEEDGLDDSLENAITGQLKALDSQLAALRWRQAALRLVRDCAAEERTARLRLIGAFLDGAIPPDTTALARFWRRVLPLRLPARQVAWILDAAVPQPPADPTPDQVLAFARLHALVTMPCPPGHDWRPPPPERDPEYRPTVLYDGLGEAYALAAPALTTGQAPHDGEALDCFVSAYAHAHGARDTPDFRRALSLRLGSAGHPVMARYWDLADDLATPDTPTLGAAQTWLQTALNAHVAVRCAH